MYQIAFNPQYFYIEGDWRTFAETKWSNESHNGYYDTIVDEYAGACIDSNRDVGSGIAGYDDRLADEDFQEYYEGSQISRYPSANYEWWYSGDINADFASCSKNDVQKWYKYDGKQTSKAPTLRATNNNETMLQIKEFGDNDYLIGPMTIINNADKIDRMSFTVTYRNNDTYVFNPVDSTGKNLTENELKGNVNIDECYLKVSKNTVIERGGIYQINAILEKDYIYHYEEHTEGRRIWQKVGDGYAQRVADLTPTKTDVTPEDTTGTISIKLSWENFQGAITIHKQDELSWTEDDGNCYTYDSDGNKVTMDGINFIVNKFNDGWAVYDTYGNIKYGNIDANHKPVIFTTDKTGKTQTIVGFDTVNTSSSIALEDGTIKEIMQNIDGSTYMAFEIIDDNCSYDGGNYSLPDKFRDLYKATYSEGQLWGCPYSLKSLGNGDLTNFDGGNDSVYDDFNRTRQYYDPNTYPEENFGEFINDSAIRFLYSGEFEDVNLTNKRDYVSLTLEKKDKNTSDIDLKGLGFKVYKVNTGGLKEGEYGWVQKIQTNNEHSDVKYVDGNDGYANAFEIVVDSNGKWTDSSGNIRKLRRLANHGTYIIYESKIPESLQNDYKLDYGESSTGGVSLRNI